MVKRCYLTRPDATMATDATECANMLNNYFHQQFHRYHQLSSIPKKIMTDYGHRTDPDVVAKLLRGRQNGKAPGPDNLGKNDLTRVIKMTAECLSLIYNKSIEQGELPLD